MTCKKYITVGIEKLGYSWGEVKQLTEDKMEWRKIWKEVPEAALI